MIVAPTEPPIFFALGPRALLPERYGVDFFWRARGASWGVQRKEVMDLLASAGDGRLTKEALQAQSLERAWLVVEGSASWTVDDVMMSEYGRTWTGAGYRNLLRSLADRGFSIEHTRTMAETMDRVLEIQAYTKDSHRSLDRRPGPVALWGKADSRDYQLHLLQGLPGIGPELAERILDDLGMPFGWAVTREALMAVKGLGKKKVDGIWGALREAGTLKTLEVDAHGN